MIIILHHFPVYTCYMICVMWCEMLGMSYAKEVAYWACAMLGMWGCLGCGILEIWDVQDAGWWGWGMFGMLELGDVGYLGCGILGM